MVYERRLEQRSDYEDDQRPRMTYKLYLKQNCDFYLKINSKKQMLLVCKAKISLIENNLDDRVLRKKHLKNSQCTGGAK